MNKFIIVVVAIFMSIIFTGYDTDVSQLVSDSEDFTSSAWNAMIDDITDSLGFGSGEKDKSTAGSSEEDNESDESITFESDDEDSTESKDKDSNDEKGSDSDSSGEKEETSDIDSVTKSDLKNKIKASDSFGCEKIYGFLKSEEVMLLSKNLR